MAKAKKHIESTDMRNADAAKEIDKERRGHFLGIFVALCILGASVALSYIYPRPSRDYLDFPIRMMYWMRNLLLIPSFFILVFAGIFWPTFISESKPWRSPGSETWRGTLSEQRSSWICSREHPSLKECLLAVAMAIGVMMYIVLPTMVVGWAFLAVFLANDQNPWHIYFLDLEFFQKLLLGTIGIGLLSGGFLAYGMATPRLVSFEFDVADQVLRSTIVNIWGRKTSFQLTFDSITSIRPIYFSSYSTDGAFFVNLNDTLGSGIPSEVLAKHLNWLRPHLGDALQSELRLDT